MSPITTHILDTARGCPAAGVAVVLERRTEADDWQRVARGVTNEDGRLSDLLSAGSLEAATYRLTFETGPYMAKQGITTFYPHVPIVFEVVDAGQHYHVPLLLSPFGYSTYRGS